MQLFAYDAFQKSVLASSAQRQTDYRCIECGGVVRVRGGHHRRQHYYHLYPSHGCRSSGKSMHHLQVQWWIQSQLPKEECLLEKPFPAINRIADVSWESKKIIFEVQCSGISAEEIANRNQDYGQLGYQVIWILHDKKYNKYRQTQAEAFLRNLPHYFTNIDIDGNGTVYDQLDNVRHAIRFERLGRYPVNISEPRLQQAAFLRQEAATAPIPEHLSKKMAHPIYFKGDLIDQLSQGDQHLFKKLSSLPNIEEPITPMQRSSKFVNFWNHCVVHPLKVLHLILLERACLK